MPCSRMIWSGYWRFDRDGSRSHESEGSKYSPIRLPARQLGHTHKRKLRRASGHAAITPSQVETVQASIERVFEVDRAPQQNPDPRVTWSRIIGERGVDGHPPSFSRDRD